jgi:hypothetical protein
MKEEGASMLIGDRTQENPEPGNVYRVLRYLGMLSLNVGVDGRRYRLDVYLWALTCDIYEPEDRVFRAVIEFQMEHGEKYLQTVIVRDGEIVEQLFEVTGSNR